MNLPPFILKLKSSMFLSCNSNTGRNKFFRQINKTLRLNEGN